MSPAEPAAPSPPRLDAASAAPRAEFLLSYRPAREGMPEAPTEAEAEAVGRHFEYLRRLHAAGSVGFVGRTLAAPFVGLAVLRAADLGEAEAVASADPAVAAGVMRIEVQPFRVVFGGQSVGA